jgi:hypothetical protein
MAALRGSAVSTFKMAIQRFRSVSIAVVIVMGTIAPSALAGGPVIERFEAVPDCIFPNPTLGILAYRVSGGITQIRIDALHRDGRVRPFYQSTFRTPIPAASSAWIADPDAAADVEAYRITVTGEAAAVRQELKFRYRRANFELIPPTFHTRITSGSGRTALYQSRARLLNVDSLTCTFARPLGFGTEARRTGTAELGADRASGEPIVKCFVTWPRVRDANAGGTVEWTARVHDRCTQGIITQDGRVNPIR